MQRFLDVHRVVDSIIEGCRERLDELGVSVEIEDGLHCNESVQEATVSEVFAALLDTFLGAPPVPGERVRIGWLPTSNGSRVFFLTNAREGSDGSGVSEPAGTDGMPNGAIREASLRVEREGGRLWAEEGTSGERTFFVLFGPQAS